MYFMRTEIHGIGTFFSFFLALLDYPNYVNKKIQNSCQNLYNLAKSTTTGKS